MDRRGWPVMGRRERDLAGSKQSIQTCSLINDQIKIWESERTEVFNSVYCAICRLYRSDFYCHKWADTPLAEPGKQKNTGHSAFNNFSQYWEFAHVQLHRHRNLPAKHPQSLRTFPVSEWWLLFWQALQLYWLLYIRWTINCLLVESPSHWGTTRSNRWISSWILCNEFKTPTKFKGRPACKQDAPCTLCLAQICPSNYFQPLQRGSPQYPIQQVQIGYRYWTH